LHWHQSDDEVGNIWVYCVGKCKRGYSIYEYCARAGLSLTEFLKQDFEFEESKPNEVQKMAWPKNFIPLYDPRAQKGIEYIRSRGIEPDEGMYYDTQREGIVFPYYYDSIFCGAQVRMIEPWIDENGDERKVDTIPGTRLGLLVFNYNQVPFRTNIKAVIVCEGAFNALSLQQAFNSMYGGILTNPFKAIALSGSGVSQHHLEILKDLKDQGFRIIAAPDSDEAGMKMLAKLKTADVITHYALTEDDELDWNDVLKLEGKENLAKWFLRRVKGV
jgi:5S rRNA maturation endonuclease (ribonuclease M5)